jgi:hypothetical protein
MGMASLVAAICVPHQFSKPTQPPALSLPCDNLAGKQTIVRPKDGYSDDLTKSADLVPHTASGWHVVFALPGEPCTGRVSGALMQ